MVASNLDGKTRMTDSELAPRKPDNTITVVSELMMPNQVNNLGHVFGGELLSMVGRAAAVAAMRDAVKSKNKDPNKIITSMNKRE